MQDLKVFAKNPDATTSGQIRSFSQSPVAEGSKIRIMPDAHAGSGCVIGTTMTVKDRICPNLVGVDIGCGVLATRLDAEEIDFAKLDAAIRENIPSGFLIRDNIHPLADDLAFKNLACADAAAPSKWAKAIGTLGGGNHFIEVDRDGEGAFWLVIHSGSRNPGFQVAAWHQKRAKERHPEAKELAWLEGDEFADYVHDMKFMQAFAVLNRRVITADILRLMGWKETDSISTIHNYLDTDAMILRKGAVSAQKGERFLLPMNMRDGTFICEGLGNPDWNFSAPHGAGRILSRGEAKRRLSLSDMEKEMDGVWTSSLSEDTLDEAPGAYKPAAEILDAIGETALISGHLKPVYNFKAAEGGRRRKR